MIDIKELINNPWQASLIVLITQILFIYFRTLNVMYVAERKLLRTLITGNLIGALWLVSIAIGANAILTLQYQPILAHLIGGSLGTYWAFISKK